MADLSLKTKAGLVWVQCTETTATDSQRTPCDKRHDQFSHVLPLPEYVGSFHPRNKIESQTNKSKPKRGRGRPPTHGLSRTPIYNSHRDAKSRCEDTKDSDYPNYGGRGIKYLFKTVADLHAAIGDRPSGQTLDRIDPEGNYVAGNSGEIDFATLDGFFKKVMPYYRNKGLLKPDAPVPTGLAAG